MRIHENGFTERVATPATPATPPPSVAPTPETAKVAGSLDSAGNPAAAGTGDNLQLSGFAARLNSGLAAESSVRAQNVSRVADAVNAGTFQIDTAAVSRSIVKEGLQTAR